MCAVTSSCISQILLISAQRSQRDQPAKCGLWGVTVQIVNESHSVLGCLQTCTAHHRGETLLLVDSGLVHGPAEPGAGSG